MPRLTVKLQNNVYFNLEYLKLRLNNILDENTALLFKPKKMSY